MPERLQVLTPDTQEAARRVQLDRLKQQVKVAAEMLESHLVQRGKESITFVTSVAWLTNPVFVSCIKTPDGPRLNFNPTEGKLASYSLWLSHGDLRLLDDGTVVKVECRTIADVELPFCTAIDLADLTDPQQKELEECLNGVADNCRYEQTEGPAEREARHNRT